MADFLVYWQRYWKATSTDPNAIDELWHTAKKSFWEKVRPGDALWVVVNGGRQKPSHWRLLQKIVVQKKTIKPSLKERFVIIGDESKRMHFDIAKQRNLAPILYKLEFQPFKPLKLKGSAIGNALQAQRSLTKADVTLLTQYALSLARSITDPRFEFFSYQDSEEKVEKAARRAGAGFGDPETNRKVEKAAIHEVTRHYKENGWVVYSVEALKCGYDLKCSKGQEQRHVEVKGVQGTEPSFPITFGEVRSANEDPDFSICIVTSALSKKPKMHEHVGYDFVRLFDLKPITYRASLKKR